MAKTRDLLDLTADARAICVPLPDVELAQIDLAEADIGQALTVDGVQKHTTLIAPDERRNLKAVWGVGRRGRFRCHAHAGY
ncbi:hypothetical protein GCM10010937_16950 [Gluconobacter japonicus]|uniref:Uncharacterized protein n=1 Tax=Gluconobacter japonicus TaxID=376620 RepID=A0ABQ5WIT6_GLUJA|nr:hypothetical protein GCM10010937_16950 [Gluconobacter japonicus]